jgi:hypothetical protein
MTYDEWFLKRWADNDQTLVLKNSPVYKSHVEAWNAALAAALARLRELPQLESTVLGLDEARSILDELMAPD